MLEKINMNSVTILVFGLLITTVLAGMVSDDKCNVNPCSTGKSCVTVYTCACPAGYEGDECKKVSAFNVGVAPSSVVAATTKVSFSPINFTPYITPYDTSSNTLTVSQKSLYWFHLSAGVSANSATNYRLNGLNYSAFVYSTVTAYPQDQLTTDTLQWVTPNTPLSVSSDKTLYSTSNYETAWLGFRLDNLFDPLVAFAAQLTKSYTTSSPIVFDRVLVNEGNGYNVNDGSFTAPVTGTYFFSSTAVTNFHITVNNNLKTAVVLNDNVHTSNDLVSTRGSIMLTLNAKDKVQITPRAYNPYQTNQDGFANFNGFLYSPKSGTKVAWSVSKSTSVMGPSDYVNFENVITNDGNCWIAASNKVIISVSGIYYIDIGSPRCGKGFWYCYQAKGTGDTVIQVLRNSDVILNSRLSGLTYENCGVRSRATMVTLNKGDELRVNVPTAGCHYSDHTPMTWFNGFLLFPTI